MKVLRVILWILGVCNILAGIITVANAPKEFAEQGLKQLIMGVAFCGGAIYCSQRINAKEQEQKEYKDWQNNKE